jgi:hypothetical protein
LTKHGLSRERLDKLVKLHWCGYQRGRSELAPLVRTGASARITMATADIVGNVGNVNSPEHIHDNDFAVKSGELLSQASPTMPHLDCTGHGLDEAHPSIIAPADDQLEDMAAAIETKERKAQERGC